MRCSEIETSSLFHPVSTRYLHSPLFLFFCSITQIISISLYLSAAPHSFYLVLSHAQIVRHLSNQSCSFFSENSPVMDFSFQPASHQGNANCKFDVCHQKLLKRRRFSVDQQLTLVETQQQNSSFCLFLHNLPKPQRLSYWSCSSDRGI